MRNEATDAIVESDEELLALVSDPATELVGLLPALAHALADPALLPPDLRPDGSNPLAQQGGWNEAELARVRKLAVSGLARVREGDGTRDVSEGLIHAAIDWVTGGERTDDYRTMLAEELAPGGSDPRSTSWQIGDVAADRPFSVVIIGAGMSGLLMAHRLTQAGVAVTILDKNPDLGGTWHENVYPGCRVDVANHTYSYSFMQKFDWPEYNSSQPVLREYFATCADEWDVRRLIRFDHEVTAMVWDDSRSVWTLEVAAPDGETTIEAPVVVSAVGQLNRPKMPSIPGVGTFAGRSWHSARWPEGESLRGQRVGIIGTGSSAAQFIPFAAEEAASLTVFQRTANWLIPRPQANQPVAEAMSWMFSRVPYFGNWHRLGMFWRGHEGLRPRVVVDPDWNEDVEHSVSAQNAELRALMLAYLESEFEGRPDLLDKVRPDHPLGAKRFVLDFGAWAEALKRESVSLVTEPIAQITAEGVQTDDGTMHEFDVLIYGTGFTASDFLMPMKVTGRDGADLQDRWQGDARAYLGITIPEMPNLFLMYGPNTNIVINGSIIFFSECEAHYITEAVRELVAGEARSMTVTPEAHDQFNEWVDDENLRMAWGVSNVSSWYKNATGRSAQNWPFTMLEYWQRTRSVDPDAYRWD